MRPAKAAAISKELALGKDNTIISSVCF